MSMKEERRKLQEALRKSCKGKIDEEERLTKRIKSKDKELETALISLDIIKKERYVLEKYIDSLRTEELELLANRERVRVKSEAQDIETEKKRTVVRNENDLLKSDRKGFNDYVEEKMNNIHNEEVRLKSIASRNEEDEKNLDKEKETFKDEKKKLSDRKLEFNETLFQFSEEKKKHLKELNDLRAKGTVIDKKTKDAQNLWNKAQKQLSMTENKEKKFKEKEEEQNDRDLEQNARETQLDKKERRVNNLMETYGDKRV